MNPNAPSVSLLILPLPTCLSSSGRKYPLLDAQGKVISDPSKPFLRCALASFLIHKSKHLSISILSPASNHGALPLQSLLLPLQAIARGIRPRDLSPSPPPPLLPRPPPPRRPFALAPPLQEEEEPEEKRGLLGWRRWWVRERYHGVGGLLLDSWSSPVR